MEIATHQHEPVPPEEVTFLPDDIVLQVFHLLTVPELFRARVVCRRWAELALHADLWRAREVCTSPRGVFKATMRLAPCVRTLLVNETRPDARPVAKLAARTRCAVENLRIHLFESDAQAGAAVVRKQVSLGRLRRLHVFLYQECPSVPLGKKSMHLVHTACAAEGLSELTLSIRTTDDFTFDWLPVNRPRPSLRKLDVAFSNFTWGPVLEHLTEWHGPTLEVLRWRGPDDVEAPVLPLECWSDCLRGAVRLRELDCPLLDDTADALPHCVNLESLTLRLDSDLSYGGDLYRRVGGYLGSATQLRRLAMRKWLPDEDDLDPILTMVVNLVHAASYCSQSALEVLDLQLGRFKWGSSEWRRGVLAELMAAVGRFAALRELHLNVEDDKLLWSLLERLSLAGPLELLRLRPGLETSSCDHAWIHSRASTMVMKSLQSYPRLHLDLFGNGYYHCGACYHCDMQCHSLWSGGKSKVVLFGHAEDAPCDAPSHADRDAVCFRIEPRPPSPPGGGASLPNP